MLRLLCLLKEFWTPMARLECIEKLTLGHLAEFCATFLSNLKGQFLIQGNISVDAAREVALQLPSLLKYQAQTTRPEVSLTIFIIKKYCCQPSACFLERSDR